MRSLIRNADAGDIQTGVNQSGAGVPVGEVGPTQHDNPATALVFSGTHARSEGKRNNWFCPRGATHRVPLSREYKWPGYAWR